jgi:hypothetical protein
MKSQGQKRPDAVKDVDPVSDWLEKNGIGAGLWKMMFGVYMALMIYGQIAVANSQQAAFSVGERNALGAAFAFLTPVESIFKFLEDTVTVQINYSLAAGTKVSLPPPPPQPQPQPQPQQQLPPLPPPPPPPPLLLLLLLPRPPPTTTTTTTTTPTTRTKSRAYVCCR